MKLSKILKKALCLGAGILIFQVNAITMPLLKFAVGVSGGSAASSSASSSSSGSSGSDGGGIIEFDASRAWSGETSSNGAHKHTFTTGNNTGVNAIYGASSTVQPPAMIGMLIIKY